MDILEEEIKKADDKNGYVNGVDSNRLLSFIERIERLEEEKKVFRTIFEMSLLKQKLKAGK